jgi:hypothetical protein
MKQSAGLEVIIVAVQIGIAAGILFTRWIEHQFANYGARLAMLEQDHSERMQLKAKKRALLGFATRCLHKITFGLIKAD